MIYSAGRLSYENEVRDAIETAKGPENERWEKETNQTSRPQNQA